MNTNRLNFRFWDGKNMIMQPNDSFALINGLVFYHALNGDLQLRRDMIPLQSTGLSDKNGVEIFEGDLLKCVTQPRSGIWSDSRLWDEKPFIVKWIPCVFNIAPSIADICVVAGNIYQHPHLRGTE